MSNVVASVSGAQKAIVSSPGSATPGVDYTPAIGTLIWANGDSSAKTFGVSISYNVASENAETVNVFLSDASGGAVIGATLSSVLTIEDSDDPAFPDFNADNKPDILWRHTPSGSTYVWYMNLSLIHI